MLKHYFLTNASLVNMIPCHLDIYVNDKCHEFILNDQERNNQTPNMEINIAGKILS